MVSHPLQSHAGWSLVQLPARGSQGSPEPQCPPKTPGVPPHCLCSSAGHCVLLFPCQGHMNHLEPTALPERFYCHRHEGRPGGASRLSAGTATIAEIPELQHQRFFPAQKVPAPSHELILHRPLSAPPVTQPLPAPRRRAGMRHDSGADSWLRGSLSPRAASREAPSHATPSLYFIFFFPLRWGNESGKFPHSPPPR